MRGELVLGGPGAASTAGNERTGWARGEGVGSVRASAAWGQMRSPGAANRGPKGGWEESGARPDGRGCATPARPARAAPRRGPRPRPLLQPRRRGGVSRDEPAPFIQEVKATSGSMKTNGEPGGKEGKRGGGSAAAREGAAGLRKREREAGGDHDCAAAAAARPGMPEPAPGGPRAARGGRRPGL